VTVKVVIDTPGPTITVEAEGELADIAAKALELFKAAGGWPQQGNTVGFGTVAANVERVGSAEYVTAHPIDLKTTKEN
jgi:hypothetical protein